MCIRDRASTRRQTPVIRLRARCDSIGFIIFEQVIYDLFFIFSAGIPHSSGVVLIVKTQNFPPFGLRPSVPQSRFGLPTFSGLPFRSTLRIRRDTDKTTHPLIEYTEPPLRALLRHHSKRRSSHTLIPRFVFSTRHNPHKFGSAPLTENVELTSSFSSLGRDRLRALPSLTENVLSRCGCGRKSHWESPSRPAHRCNR